MVYRQTEYGADWLSGRGALAEVLKADPKPHIVIRRVKHIEEDTYQNTFAGFSSVQQLRASVNLCRRSALRFSEMIMADAACRAYFLVKVNMENASPLSVDDVVSRVVDTGEAFLAWHAATSIPTDTPTRVVTHVALCKDVGEAECKHVVVRMESPVLFFCGIEEREWFAERLKTFVEHLPVGALEACIADGFKASCVAGEDGAYGIGMPYPPCVPLPRARYDARRLGVGVPYARPGEAPDHADARDLVLCALGGMPPAHWVRLPTPPSAFFNERAAKRRRECDEAALPVDELYQPLMTTSTVNMFTVVTQPRVTPIVFGPGVKVVVDSSGMGCGKSHQGAKYVESLPPGASALFLVPRVLLAREHVQTRLKALGFVDYTDVADRAIPVSAYPRLVCGIESAHRLYELVHEPHDDDDDDDDGGGGDESTPRESEKAFLCYNRYDFAFLDESELAAASVGSITRRNSAHDKKESTVGRWRTLQALRAVLQKASEIFVADAHVSQLTVLLLRACLGSRARIHHRRMAGAPNTGRQFQLVYGYNDAKGIVSPVETAAKLVSDHLQNERRVFVPCCRKDYGEALFSRLHKMHPTVDIMLLSRDEDASIDESRVTYKLDQLRSREQLPTVFIYTAVYGVGNSFDHVHFDACVVMLSGDVLAPDQVSQLMGRVRHLRGAPPAYALVCDGTVHDYDLVGGPWKATSLTQEAFDTKVAQKVHVIAAHSHAEAKLKLNTDPDLRRLRHVVRASTRRTRFWMYSRKPPPNVPTREAVRKQLMTSPRVNHVLGTSDEALGEWSVAKLQESLSEEDLTVSFHHQKGFVDFVAEVKRQGTKQRLMADCVATLRRSLLDHGYTEVPARVMTVHAAEEDESEPESDGDDGGGDDDVADAESEGSGHTTDLDNDDDADDAEDAEDANLDDGADDEPLPTLDAVLDAARGRVAIDNIRHLVGHHVTLSDETIRSIKEARRILDVGFALATFGSPDGSSWGTPGPPDAARAYAFDEAVHAKREHQEVFRTACRLMKTGAQPRDVLEEEAREWRAAFDMDALGKENRSARRVHALQCLSVLGLDDMAVLVGRVRQDADAPPARRLTKADVDALRLFCAWRGESVGLCSTCGSKMNARETPPSTQVCGACDARVFLQIKTMAKSVFGVVVTRTKGRVRVAMPPHWPPCGPTWEHRVAYERFKDAYDDATMDGRVGLSSDRRDALNTLKEYAASLQSMDLRTLKNEYVRRMVNAGEEPASGHAQKHKLKRLCIDLRARELHVDL